MKGQSLSGPMLCGTKREGVQDLLADKLTLALPFPPKTLCRALSSIRRESVREVGWPK